MTEREHFHAKCLPRNFDPLSISADFDCDVDTESDDQQLSVVEVEGRTFAKVTLEGVLLQLCERPSSWSGGLDSVQFVSRVHDVHTVTSVLTGTTGTSFRLRVCLSRFVFSSHFL